MPRWVCVLGWLVARGDDDGSRLMDDPDAIAVLAQTPPAPVEITTR